MMKCSEMIINILQVLAEIILEKLSLYIVRFTQNVWNDWQSISSVHV